MIWRIKPSPFINSNGRRYVATAGGDGLVGVWDSTNDAYDLIWTRYYSSWVHAIEWIDKDTLASVGDADGVIEIWSIISGEIKQSIDLGHPASPIIVRSIKLLSNGIHLAAGLMNNENNVNITIYDINTGDKVAILLGHTDWINDMIQISDSDLLASSSFDNTVRIWNLTTNECKFVLQGHTSLVYGLKQLSKDVIASGDTVGIVILWNITSGALIRNLTAGGDIRWSLDLVDPQTLVSGSWFGAIMLWNWSTGELLNTTFACRFCNFYSLAVVNPIQSKKLIF
jgi:WD40 repeat protein